ncbi:fibronectin type III domain-containing protein [bacterium]|nr:fibronectin type III domain-containing protein [bacterium]
MKMYLKICCALLLLLGLTACSGGSSGLQDPASSARLDSTPAGSAPGLPGLAGLDQLSAGSREASILGPGWYELWHEDIIDSASMTEDLGNGIILSPGAGNAYALYCLRGFNSDFSPTSLRVMPDAGGPSYMLLFADFVSGRWTSTGPQTGNVEIEVPGTDDGTRHPLDFVSPAGRVYVAVLTDGSGSDLKIDNIELGIHGGLLAPRPPSSVFASLYTNGSVANWEHSPDYNKPDFAGYVVERKDLLTNEWGTVANTTPLDTSVLLPGPRQVTGYRVAALDVAGNQSSWTFTNDGGGILTASEVMQVDVVMPRGPLYGPVEVDFDLSGSSSPTDPIMEYQVDFEDNSLDYVGASPTISRVLQPGCYYIRFAVNDGSGFGADFGETSRTLVVYPQWEPSPLLVQEADLFSPVGRFTTVNGIAMQGTDDLLVVSDDLTLPGTVIRRGRPGSFSFDSLPFIGDAPHQYSDPALLGDTAYLGVKAGSGQNYIIACSPGGSHIIEGSFSFTRLVPVSNGESLFLIITTATAVGFADLTGGSSLVPIATGLTGNNYMDACWNPVTATVDIMLDDGGSLSYLSWDPAAMIITDDDSALLSPVEGGIDVEADPTTGELCVVSRSVAKNVFLRKPAGGAFAAPQEIDSPIINYWPADLAWHGGVPYATFAGGGGETRTYRLDAAGATTYNTADYTVDGFYTGCLLDDPASGKLLVCDRDSSASLYIAELNDDDSETILETLLSDRGWGRWLDSAVGADGYHLIMGNAFLNGVSHMVSADGAGWTTMGSATTDGYVDLFDNRAGEVFMTLRDASGYDVSYWDGAAWSNRWIVPGAQTREAVSAGNRASNTTAWVLEDTVAANLLRSQGNAGGFTTSTTAFPETTHIHKGRLVYDSIGGISPAFVLYSKPAVFQSFGLLNAYSGDVQDITWFSDGSTLISDLASFDDRETAARTMEMLPFRSGTTRYNATQIACWSVGGYNGSAFRYTFRNDSGVAKDIAMNTLPFRNVDWRSEDMRRTVSAAQANGLTAVSVMSSLDGKHSRMEWSCFGEWEELPMPAAAGRTAQTELLVDANGRWYMFWRDPESSRVYCLRSLD